MNRPSLQPVIPNLGDTQQYRNTPATPSIMSASVGKKNTRGFSLLEFGSMLLMILMVLGFGVSKFRRNQRVTIRNDAALELVEQIDEARLDSMRRGAKTLEEFAGVTIRNPTSYLITKDGADNKSNGERLITLNDGDLRFSGPFPITILFDRLGRPTDNQGQIIEYPLLAVMDSRGSTFIKFANSGKPFLSDTPKY